MQAQSQGAITFKVVPSIKEEAPSKEPKVGPVPVAPLLWLGHTTPKTESISATVSIFCHCLMAQTLAVQINRSAIA